MDRMVGECLAKGGNAVVAMRFESGEIGGKYGQVCAYGTACIVEKMREKAIKMRRQDTPLLHSRYVFIWTKVSLNR